MDIAAQPAHERRLDAIARSLAVQRPNCSACWDRATQTHPTADAATKVL
eukprot:SAG31_NODE_25988_length_450_cov_1.188034_1_plen_48_part_01